MIALVDLFGWLIYGLLGLVFVWVFATVKFIGLLFIVCGLVVGCF